jgi:hypothetical protein
MAESLAASALAVAVAVAVVVTVAVTVVAGHPEALVCRPYVFPCNVTKIG